jgi:hypothetical protein
MRFLHSSWAVFTQKPTVRKALTVATKSVPNWREFERCQLASDPIADLRALGLLLGGSPSADILASKAVTKLQKFVL